MKSCSVATLVALLCLSSAAGDAVAFVCARRDFRKSIAAGGAVAEKAVSDGLVSSDPAIRRAALWELYTTDKPRALGLLQSLVEDPSLEVGTLVAELARAIPDRDAREALLRDVVAHGTTPQARKIAAAAIPFPFSRDNVPLSKNPTYDHDFTKAFVMDLPMDGWRFRADVGSVGHLGDAAFFRNGCDWMSDGWKGISIGRHWENFKEVGNYDGIGWCAVEFDLPAKVEGLSCELCFDAVDEEAWVWLNGEYVGQHAEGVDGWNKPFRFDVGKELHWGGRNRLVVRVNDTFAAGGIWKGVRLEVLK